MNGKRVKRITQRKFSHFGLVLVVPYEFAVFWSLFCGFWLMVSGLWFLVSLVSGLRVVVSGFWCLVSGFWRPLSQPKTPGNQVANPNAHKQLLGRTKHPQATT